MNFQWYNWYKPAPAFPFYYMMNYQHCSAALVSECCCFSDVDVTLFNAQVQPDQDSECGVEGKPELLIFTGHGCTGISH